MCDILGVVETDYFGLCYKDKFGLMWLNKRVLLQRQLKDRRPPYLLDMRVKFYVPPDCLQQKATRWAGQGRGWGGGGDFTHLLLYCGCGSLACKTIYLVLMYWSCDCHVTVRESHVIFL